MRYCRPAAESLPRGELASFLLRESCTIEFRQLLGAMRQAPAVAENPPAKPPRHAPPRFRAGGSSFRSSGTILVQGTKIQTNFQDRECGAYRPTLFSPCNISSADCTTREFAS